MTLFGLAFYLTLINWSIVSLVFLSCKKKGRFDFIFTYWGLGIVIMAWSAMLIEALVDGPSLNKRQLISNILVSLWGIRLSIYLFYRNFWVKEDPRYINLQKEIGNEGGFMIYRSIFLYRGLLQLIVIAPIISLNFLPGPNSLNIFDYLGFIIFICGYLIETRSDRELREFKKQLKNKSKVLKSGLWQYCRHPNYFGDTLQWWGLYIIACSAVGGAWSFYGPLFLTWIFLKKSINTVEERLVIQRPGYSEYIKSTNKLLPSFRKDQIKIFARLHYLFPHKLLTFIAGYFSRSKIPFLKNFLINIFCFLYKPNLSEAKRVNLKEYNSFNDFFTRSLKPEARIIDSSETKVISPVDGTITSFGKIELGELIQAKKIKYRLEDLVEDKDLEKLFKEGSYITIYLAPFDYHRIHFPMDGTIKGTKHFPGSLYSVNKSSLKTITSLYTKNERTLVHVQSNKFSYSLISVGASMVGSIIPFWKKDKIDNKEKISSIWNEGPPSDQIRVKKGQELGYFQMGSTVILLFPSSIKLNNNFLSEFKAVKLGEVLIDLLH